MLSYVTAITSAVSIAVGLTVFVQRTKLFSPQVRRSLQRLIAFPATGNGISIEYNILYYAFDSFLNEYY